MRLSELSAANDLLDDQRALAERYDRDGALLVRGVLSPAVAGEIASQACAVLNGWGLTKPVLDPGEPRWNGAPVGARDTVELDGVAAVSALIDDFDDPSQHLGTMVDAACGHHMHLWRGACFFEGFPDDPAYVTKPHSDGWARGPGDNRRVWIAITHIGFGDGGLGLALGSHRAGPFPYRQFPELRIRPGVGPLPPRTTVQGIDPALVGDHWHSAQMSPGDALIFHHDLVHRGRAFSSDRIRLALVVMATAEGDPRPEVTYTKAEGRERNRRLSELGNMLGLSDAEIRQLVRHFYGSASPVNEATVRAALAGIEKAFLAADTSSSSTTAKMMAPEGV